MRKSTSIQANRQTVTRRRQDGSSRYNTLLQNLLLLAGSAAVFKFTGQWAHADTPTRPSDEPELSTDASPDEIFGAVFGSKMQNAVSLPYPVIISGLNKGDVVMTPSTVPGETRVDRKALVDLLLPFLIDEKQLELLEAFSARDEITVADLQGLGLLAEFDIPDLLRLSAPVALFDGARGPLR